MDKFVADVKGVYEKYKRCVIAVSEGIADEQGTAIAAKFIKETDSHGNIQLSGSGALGDVLAKEIKEKAEISRVRADTFVTSSARSSASCPPWTQKKRGSPAQPP